MAHQYSRVGFKSSVEVNEVNLSLSYGGVMQLVGTWDYFQEFCARKGAFSIRFEIFKEY